MKALVKTTGPFQLVCPESGQTIPAHRPAVISQTGFFQQRTLIGQVALVKELPDNADDQGWAHFLRNEAYAGEGGLAKAVEDYLAFVSPTPPTETKPPPVETKK
jgi:hypothetical protein